MFCWAIIATRWHGSPNHRHPGGVASRLPGCDRPHREVFLHLSAFTSDFLLCLPIVSSESESESGLKAKLWPCRRPHVHVSTDKMVNGKLSLILHMKNQKKYHQAVIFMCLPGHDRAPQTPPLFYNLFSMEALYLHCY